MSTSREYKCARLKVSICNHIVQSTFMCLGWFVLDRCDDGDVLWLRRSVCGAEKTFLDGNIYSRY